MADIVIEQAILTRFGGTCRLLARSPGFEEGWQAEVERLAAGFGERPEGVVCPAALFAQPFGEQHVAVVRVVDQLGEVIALAFHFLLIPRDAYTRLWGDPFVLAERAPAVWQMRGELPALTWPPEPLPPRTVRDVQEVLQQTRAAALTEDEEPSAAPDTEDAPSPELALSPALLGGVQILVDGGRLVFERPAPDPGLMRGLWTLLPTSMRCRLWPASFAFGNALGFDALVVPPARARDAYPGYTDEDQACEYPQGYYELNLQVAAEAGNQAELDGLLGRRSWKETWRMGLGLLAVIAGLALALNLFRPPPRPAPGDPPGGGTKQKATAAAASVVGVAHPWSALGMLKAGKQLWPKPSEEKP